ncbi:MAG: amidohydrolase [Methanoregulaceae archaeon]|nr:amidohydrolase [Methanoregulaceae archaeon]
MTPRAGRIRETIDRELPSLLDLYRRLHAQPELSGEEETTSRTLAAELERAGFAVSEGIGGHGIVGVRTSGAGPVVMIRADMDALPVAEETGLPYASRIVAKRPEGSTVSVMHACGHDIHMSVLAGTARVLADLVDEWEGTLLLVGQPAEETGRGATAMIDDGIFTRFPVPDSALALHVGPDLPKGIVGFREGIFSAGSESLDIVIRGIGGHAAHPDRAIDPVVLAARIILAFQTIVSRELPPLGFGVVTVASIHGGAKYNAIPDTVSLQANIRYFSEQVREKIMESIRRITRNIALSAGVPEDLLPEVKIAAESVPPLVNDTVLTERVSSILRDTLGEERVIRIDPLTGSEDFGFFGMLEPRVPLCYFRIGTGGGPYLHNSRFAPDPGPAISLGVFCMALAALELLGKK